MLCINVDVDRIYGTVWYWLRTNRMYVGMISACLNWNVAFLRCTMTPSQLYTRLLFNYNGNDTRLCADVDVDWIWNGIILALDEQKVRCWFKSMSEFECVIAWYTSKHHQKCTLACYIQIHNNANDTRLCTDLNDDWIYETISCSVWTNRPYVGISACLNLDVTLLGIRCTATPSQLHTCMLYSNTRQWQWQMALRWCKCWLDIWNDILFALDEQDVRWY